MNYRSTLFYANPLIISSLTTFPFDYRQSASLRVDSSVNIVCVLSSVGGGNYVVFAGVPQVTNCSDMMQVDTEPVHFHPYACLVKLLMQWPND